MEVSKPKSFSLAFIKKVQLTEDVTSFYFSRHNHHFSFLPGQYLRLILPHDFPDERGTSRFFTIASSPLQKDQIIITTKLMQSTFKKKLFSLQAGNIVQFFGPIGQFILKDEESTPLVFIAGGIGITPFYSMLRYVHEKKLKRAITVFVSFKTQREMIYFDELKEIEKKNKNIRIIYTLTDENDISKTWNGKKGRITDSTIKQNITNMQKHKYFLTGPSEMVDSMVEVLKDMLVPEQLIVTEKFTGY